MNFVKLFPSFFLIALVFFTSTMKADSADQCNFLRSVNADSSTETFTKREVHLFQLTSEQNHLSIQKHAGETQNHPTTVTSFFAVSWNEECDFLMNFRICTISFFLNASLQQLLYPFHFFW